jgi:excisionase family DNA binding protein
MRSLGLVLDYREEDVVAVQEKLTYSVPEVAKLLGISRGGAYELARRGKLPGAIRLGGRIVVSRRRFERALDGAGADEPPLR